MSNETRFRWQDEFSRDYRHFRKQYGDLPYFLEAGVGSGKTRAVLKLAKHLKKVREIDFIVFVCPTKTIRRGCVNEAREIGLQFQEKIRKDRHPARDYDGAAITYGALSYVLPAMRQWLERVFLIFDEPHHASAESEDPQSWGRAVKDAIEVSSGSIGMSGTPFRTSGERLAGFERCYRRDRFVPDHLFTVEQGLKAKTIRPVWPITVGGRFWYGEEAEEWMMIEDVENPETVDNGVKGYWEEKERLCLRSTARTREDWFGDCIYNCNEQLEEFRRKGHPQAKALVVVAPGEYAPEKRTLTDACLRIKEIVGEEPIKVAFDEPASEDLIDQFQESSDKFIVSVNKISEGVNIPNLRCLVMATVYATELSFLQMLGRVMRWPNQDPNQSIAYAWLPRTGRNQRRASEWRLRQERVIEDKEPGGCGGGDSGGKAGPGYGNITGDSTTHIDTHESAEQEELDWAHSVIEKCGYNIPDEIFVKIARDYGIEPEKVSITRGDPERRKKYHRKEASRVVQRIAYKYGVEFAHINYALNREQNVRSVDDLHDNKSWEKMKERHTIALLWLNDGIPEKWL